MQTKLLYVFGQTRATYGGLIRGIYMNEKGRVVAIDGSFVTVEIERTSACAKCKSCRFFSGDDRFKIRAKNVSNAGLGDLVHIELPSRSFIIAALVLYGFPLLGLVTGGVIGSLVSVALGFYQFEGLFGLAAGLIFALIAYRIIKKLEPFWRKKEVSPIAKSGP